METCGQSWHTRSRSTKALLPFFLSLYILPPPPPPPLLLSWQMTLPQDGVTDRSLKPMRSGSGLNGDWLSFIPSSYGEHCNWNVSLPFRSLLHLSPCHERNSLHPTPLVPVSKWMLLLLHTKGKRSYRLRHTHTHTHMGLTLQRFFAILLEGTNLLFVVLPFHYGALYYLKTHMNSKGTFWKAWYLLFVFFLLFFFLLLLLLSLPCSWLQDKSGRNYKQQSSHTKKPRDPYRVYIKGIVQAEMKFQPVFRQLTKHTRWIEVSLLLHWGKH